MGLFNPLLEGHRVVSLASTPNEAYLTTGFHGWMQSAILAGTIPAVEYAPKTKLDPTTGTITTVINGQSVMIPPTANMLIYIRDSGVELGQPPVGDAAVWWWNSAPPWANAAFPAASWVPMIGNITGWEAFSAVINGGVSVGQFAAEVAILNSVDIANAAAAAAAQLAANTANTAISLLVPVGFLPAVAVAPTATPALRAGFVNIVYCTADDRIYVYTSGAWKHGIAQGAFG